MSRNRRDTSLCFRVRKSDERLDPARVGVNQDLITDHDRRHALLRNYVDAAQGDRRDGRNCGRRLRPLCALQIRSISRWVHCLGRSADWKVYTSEQLTHRDHHLGQDLNAMLQGLDATPRGVSR